MRKEEEVCRAISTSRKRLRRKAIGRAGIVASLLLNILTLIVDNWNLAEPRRREALSKRRRPYALTMLLAWPLTSHEQLYEEDPWHPLTVRPMTLSTT
jgi:hypothetical protein